jgi:hypothetical protein
VHVLVEELEDGVDGILESVGGVDEAKECARTVR